MKTMKRKHLAALISSYFALGIGPPITGIPGQLAVLGSMADPAALIAVLNQMTLAGIGSDSVPFATSAAATITLTAIQNLVQRLTNGGAVTVSIDAAYNIVNQIPGAFVGQTFPFEIITNAGTTVATPTLLATDVTLAGTTTVLAAAMRWYQGQITQIASVSGSAVTAGTTFTSIAQVGATNLFTVTLGTNTITPTVGNLFYLGVTAGTLPPGWYPINKVTSATSFVISTPLGAVWTATAATVPGTAVVPVSQYSPGLVGVYSPLLTITGMMATVTATMSV
jgi:hypothetical protein